MSARRRRSGVDEGRLLYRASRGDRQARAELDADEADRAAELDVEQTEPPDEQPRTPRPDPSQGARPAPIRGGMAAGREMFHERGRIPPNYDLI